MVEYSALTSIHMRSVLRLHVMSVNAFYLALNVIKMNRNKFNSFMPVLGHKGFKPIHNIICFKWTLIRFMTFAYVHLIKLR